MDSDLDLDQRRDQIGEALDLFCADRKVIEIRAIDDVYKSRPGYFDRADCLLDAVLAANEYASIYWLLNEINPPDHRVTNDLAPRPTTRNTDVTRRRWLLIDVDPKRPPGVCATKLEKTHGVIVATRVVTYLTEHGFPEPIRVDSGNGVHLYYALDAPNDDETAGLIDHFLAHLDTLFALKSKSGKVLVSIDSTTGDAGQISRLPGCWNRKGENTKERPHRMCQIVSAPETVYLVEMSDLEAVAGKPAPPVVRETPATTTTLTTRDIPALLADLGLTYTHSIDISGVDGKEYDKYALDRCPWAHEHSTGPGGAVVQKFASGAPSFSCQHASCKSNRRNWQAFCRHFGISAVKYPELTPEVLDNLSGILNAAPTTTPAIDDTITETDTDLEPMDEDLAVSLPDPGPIPAELLRVPGFVDEVMTHCLETAPYPNRPMAFCGALSLLSVLTGRKIRDESDNRTNLFILGLANSGCGKDWPRKINARVLGDVGLGAMLGEKFASGEGLQDALYLSKSMLFQNDEMDGMLQAISKSREARHEGIMSTMLTLYSSANTTFPMRKKSGKDQVSHIDQPFLTVFGTANPNTYYSALSERMLTNGFFARMLIIESDRRSVGQRGGIISIPETVLETARWWSEYRPVGGNLVEQYSAPTTVEATPEAWELIDVYRQACDSAYSCREAAGDSAGMAVWARAYEHARKLALLYAASVDRENLLITAPAVEWATRFVDHQVARMLFMAADHVAANPFHEKCLKLVQALRRCGGAMTQRQVLRSLNMSAKEAHEVASTMIASGTLVCTETKAGGQVRYMYSLPA